MIINFLKRAIFLIPSFLPAFASGQGNYDLENFKQAVSQIRHVIELNYPKSEVQNRYSEQFDEKIKFIKNEIFRYKDSLLPHLMRPFEQAHISEAGDLIIDEDERFLYDLFYEAANPIAYRSEPKLSSTDWTNRNRELNFYTSGTPYFLLSEEIENMKGLFFSTLKPLDIIQIREELCYFEKGFVNIQTPILFSPNYKDGHATLIVHILDLKNKKILSSLFLNSFVYEKYYHDMETRFNMNHRGRPGYYSCNTLIPFIDLSFDLQTQENDQNCTLYGYNYLTALTKILADENIAGTIIDAATKLIENSDNGEALVAMKHIFQDEVKKHLPQYYNADGSRKTYDEIKDYHMRLRWDLSAKQIQKFFR